jgi:uncharacterized membrane protein
MQNAVMKAEPAAQTPVQPPPITSLAAIGGHPLHPMLIHFPVAALIGLVGADAAWLYGGDDFWARAGLWLAGVGALGGWGASLVGLVDLLGVRRVRRLVSAWMHAVMAVMMLSLATLNWLLRLAAEGSAPPQPWGLALTLCTAVFIGLAALLGGRLVYEHAVGVDSGAAPAAPQPASADADDDTRAAARPLVGTARPG